VWGIGAGDFYFSSLVLGDLVLRVLFALLALAEGSAGLGDVNLERSISILKRGSWPRLTQQRLSWSWERE